MLRQLGSEVRDCYARAEDCALSAAQATTEKARDEFLRLERNWLLLARSYQFLEQLGIFAAHNKRRRGELSKRLEQLNRFLESGKSVVAAKAKSQLEAHAAKVVARDPWSTRLVEVCAIAGVQLLHYPVSAERQAPGQTMAVGAISRCLKQYGEDTLITALQCVTQTTNNRPGALTARIIKAVCTLLADDPALRDTGLALLEKFDRINLVALSNEATIDAATKKIDAVEALCTRLRWDLKRKSQGSETNAAFPCGPAA